MKKPKGKHVVGNYRLGFRNVRLVVDSGTGNGEVDLVPKEGGATEVVIGIDSPWDEALSVLLHEAYEAVLIDSQIRYKPQPSYSGESSDFIFIATHNQLSEAHERVGVFLAKALPDFTKAYRKCSLFKD
jgi:hypothetical protein